MHYKQRGAPPQRVAIPQLECVALEPHPVMAPLVRVDGHDAPVQACGVPIHPLAVKIFEMFGNWGVFANSVCLCYLLVSRGIGRVGKPIQVGIPIAFFLVMDGCSSFSSVISRFIQPQSWQQSSSELPQVLYSAI